MTDQWCLTDKYKNSEEVGDDDDDDDDDEQHDNEDEGSDISQQETLFYSSWNVSIDVLDVFVLGLWPVSAGPLANKMS